MNDNVKIFEKVLFIGPDSPSDSKGGIGSVLNSYAASLPAFRHLPTNSHRGFVPGLFNAALTLIRMPFERFKGRKIVHIHYASGKSWRRKRIVAAWARTLGFKVIMHCHAAEFKKFVARAGREKIVRELDKAVANVVLSQSWKQYFEQELKCRNVVVVNNIVRRPVSSANDAPLQSGQPFTFLFLGYLGDRKGIFDILEAVAALKDKGYKFKLIVGGNGETDRFKETVRNLGVDDFIDFRGWIMADDKNRLLAQCDVLMLPSFNEGLPISILEAFSYGKAVITSPVGGIPEIVTDGVNGTLVEPGNVSQIESAMRRYIGNPALAAEHGRHSVDIVEDFYPEAVAASLLSLYRSLL